MKATGTTLNDDQKAAATDELVTTGDLANDIGQDKAENVMNDVKRCDRGQINGCR